nr:Txe/YoeB family addiction module toxin [Enterocloster bolteae]
MLLSDANGKEYSRHYDSMVDVIRENPFQNPPSYEKLVGNLNGMYSRRINIQHRLVYQVCNERATMKGLQYDGVIKIIRMCTL